MVRVKIGACGDENGGHYIEVDPQYPKNISPAEARLDPRNGGRTIERHGFRASQRVHPALPLADSRMELHHACHLPAMRAFDRDADLGAIHDPSFNGVSELRQICRAATLA
jgi:hypothetical protein